MFLLKRHKIRSYEMGLYSRDGEFKGLLGPGKHWIVDPLWKSAWRSCRSVSRGSYTRSST